MRNLLLVIVFFLSSCVNKDEIKSDSFKNVDGLLYYEKPETGSVIYAVFFPFAKKDANFNLINLDPADFENGIKFSFAGNLIKDRLYSATPQKLILKGDIDRPVYVLSKTKIYFHIDKRPFQEDDIIDKELQVDTLVHRSRYIKFKYRFSWITLDSIKVN